MSYLYNLFDNPFAKKEIDQVFLPNSITDNLKPGFGQRPYQIEAFKRFIYTIHEDFEGKPLKPLHLLYNMATGSGKTLVMAGLILYLYEEGYRNFLFFVNSNNIIKKTKDNFLNPYASKYLFNDKIVIDGREVYIKETETFEATDLQNINIKFTTIQQLHIDLNNTKENSVTYEDFKSKEIVMIGDEAHHLNSATKNNGALFGTWEGTALAILKQNSQNILLEFTATLDYESKEIAAKYQDKVIYKYDLSQFRIDKYSKEINLMRSYYNEHDRILQALILNLYRQELAAVYHINLKPVVLFKAKKTIKESEQNKLNFHQLIDNLTAEMIDEISCTATVAIIKKAFEFFNKREIFSSDIVKRIKSNFKFENCISANSDEEAEKNQLLLNTLEDENNPIRAVFAVHKLNEGWDVLNLFDIVRLYEGQNSGGSNQKVGLTTLAEAQLIGRGARYFPFQLEDDQDKFKRKYDDDFANDLKILEELYYHTKEDIRYISELKRALIDYGIYEDEDTFEFKPLHLKEAFKKTDFYKYGKVCYNKREVRDYHNIKSFADLGVSNKNFAYQLSSGFGKMTNVFFEQELSNTDKIEIQQDLKLTAIPKHIVRYALSQNPFFYFKNLERFFPNLYSISQFIDDNAYLGGLSITLKGPQQRLKEISSHDFLGAIEGLLQAIEMDIKANLTTYQGSAYIQDYVHNVFVDKKVKVYKNKNEEHEEVEDSWYVFEVNYGTKEEKDFVAAFARKFEDLNKKYEDIYLIRNERMLKIIDPLGRAFEPDFLLFCKQKGDDKITYQVFIEPKGAYLAPFDQWKEDFLNKIKDESKIISIDTEKYKITGVPFYNHLDENKFIEELNQTLTL